MLHSCSRWEERWESKGPPTHMLFETSESTTLGMESRKPSYLPFPGPGAWCVMVRVIMIKTRICYVWGGDMANHCSCFFSFPSHRLGYTIEKEFTQRQIMFKLFRNN